MRMNFLTFALSGEGKMGSNPHFPSPRPLFDAFCRVGLLLRLRFFFLPVIADDAFQRADCEYRTFLASGYYGDGTEGHFVSPIFAFAVGYKRSKMVSRIAIYHNLLSLVLSSTNLVIINSVR